MVLHGVCRKGVGQGLLLWVDTMRALATLAGLRIDAADAKDAAPIHTSAAVLYGAIHTAQPGTCSIYYPARVFLLRWV